MMLSVLVEYAKQNLPHSTSTLNVIAKTVHTRLCTRWLKHFATFWLALAKAVCCGAQREGRGVSYDVSH